MFAQTIVAALVALPFFAQLVAADCTRTYVVKTGEICDGISAAQHVSTYQLAALNPGINADCSNLVAGWNLCLGLATEDCTTTYVVQLGDTCETIESQQGVNATMLYLNNPQISSDCSNLYVGEVLCTAQDGSAPVPSGAPPATTIPATATPANTQASTPTPAAKSPAATPDAPTVTPAPTSSADPSVETSTGDDELPFCDEI